MVGGAVVMWVSGFDEVVEAVVMWLGYFAILYDVVEDVIMMHCDVVLMFFFMYL